MCLISLSNWHPMWLISLSNWHPMWLISLSNWHPMWLISPSNWYHICLISPSNRISSLLSVTRKFLPNFLWQILQILQEAFHMRHSPKPTKKFSKMSISYETFAKITKETFQNKRFVRNIRKNCQRDLPKWAFHTRHSQELTKRSSKISESYQTFVKTNNKIFQNEHFVRDIRINGQKNRPT